MADDIETRLRCSYQAKNGWPCEECTFCAARAEIERLRAAGDELVAALTPQWTRVIPDEAEWAAHLEHREYALRAWEEARHG